MILCNYNGISYSLRNISQFDVGYQALSNTYTSESGHTILYPVRNSIKVITLKIEANSLYLQFLKAFFSQPVITFSYAIQTAQIEQGTFRKTSQIQQTIITCHNQFGHDGLYAFDENGTQKEIAEDAGGEGIYGFSVSLEEV